MTLTDTTFALNNVLINAGININVRLINAVVLSVVNGK